MTDEMKKFFESEYEKLKGRINENMELFAPFALNENGWNKVYYITHIFDFLFAAIEAHCKESPREFALLKTKLEEACFFAKKAVHLQKENQEVQE